MKKIALSLLLFLAMPMEAFSQFKDDWCYPTYGQAENEVQYLKNACVTYWGDGTIADIRINVVDGQYCAYGTCNGCKGSRILSAYDGYRDNCCLVDLEPSSYFTISNFCMVPSYPAGGWGINEAQIIASSFDPSSMCKNPPSNLDDYSFDTNNCKWTSNSSSSVDGSSSSQAMSSSSDESSSSSGSSSSGGSSSNSEDNPSSSSVNSGDSSSDSGSGFGESCEIPSYNWNYMANYGVFKRTLYPYLPYMQNRSEMYVSGCGCSGDDLIYCQIRNFNYVHDYLPNTLQLCSYSHGYWCNGIEKDGITCDFSGSSAYIYHADVPGYDWLVQSMGDNYLYPLGSQSSEFGVVHNANTSYATREVFFTHGFALPLNVYTSDLENAILTALPDFPSLDKMHAYCRGEWIPHDEDCYGTQNEVYKAMGDSVAVCGLLGGIANYSTSLSDRGWCVVGDCEFKEAENSSSSVSSSSSHSSSSSEDVSSSSSNNVNNCSTYPLLYTPSDPLNACFAKDGKCYKCNSDRGQECGNSWLWSSGFSEGNIGWWYTEVACGGGGSLQNDSGICSAYPRATPSDPLNACFTKDGKCYKCNPDRGAECGYSWVWNSGFSPGNVGWWYKEIPCGNTEEDEEEDEWELMQCSGSILEKKIFSNDSYQERNTNESAQYEIWGNKTNFFYDALGRKTQAHPETRRYLFVPKKTYEKELYLEFSESKSLLSKEYIEGYVATRHKYGLNWCTKPPKGSICLPSTPLMGNLSISLSFITEIRRFENQSNPLLKIHEDKHVEIYNSLGNKDWVEIIKIDLCEHKTIKSIVDKYCPEMRKIAKQKFEEQLRILISAQNKWDDDDKNNESTYRIDLQERINDMQQDVDAFDCLE